MIDVRGRGAGSYIVIFVYFGLFRVVVFLLGDGFGVVMVFKVLWDENLFIVERLFFFEFLIYNGVKRKKKWIILLYNEG